MDRDSEIIKTSIIGIVTNAFLVVFKLLVGIIANSIAIILDAVNNLSDMLSSIITIVGTKLASKKPDKEHPYGHGRIEYFAAAIIAVLVFSAGLSALPPSLSSKGRNRTARKMTLVSSSIQLLMRLQSSSS